MKMYSTDNERKSAVAERFVRTLKTKICKYMSSISKNIYINKLDNIVNYIVNDIYHNTTIMKLADKSQAHIRTLKQKRMVNILNLMLVTMWEYQNIEKKLLKVTLKFGLQNVL